MIISVNCRRTSRARASGSAASSPTASARRRRRARSWAWRRSAEPAPDGTPARTRPARDRDRGHDGRRAGHRAQRGTDPVAGRAGRPGRRRAAARGDGPRDDRRGVPDAHRRAGRGHHRPGRGLHARDARVARARVRARDAGTGVRASARGAGDEDGAVHPLRLQGDPRAMRTSTTALVAAAVATAAAALRLRRKAADDASARGQHLRAARGRRPGPGVPALVPRAVEGAARDAPGHRRPAARGVPAAGRLRRPDGRGDDAAHQRPTGTPAAGRCGSGWAWTPTTGGSPTRTPPTRSGTPPLPSARPRIRPPANSSMPRCATSGAS